MDRRIERAERSKAALKNAFLELVVTKDPEEITVVELCERAGLNRSTFYAHYEYMGQLIEEVLLKSVEEIFREKAKQWELPLENGGAPKAAIRAYLHNFLNAPRLERFCTCLNGEKYRTLIIRAHIELTLGPVTDPVKYYKAFYQNAGLVNFILEWIADGYPISEEEVVDIIHEFSKVMYR